MARRAGLPKSTAYRVLGMLVRVGAVEHEGTGYRIAFRMMGPRCGVARRSGPPRRATVPAGSAPGRRAHHPSVRPARARKSSM
ncbi:helix-turn-helix domain-containing protein [Streptomyces afghaniensis]|uniref:helix-turn-helix domain-containing protein n=1 Tax=Streptomyces afghaniensis TaxID=66865 RepID=UPI0033B18FF7